MVSPSAFTWVSNSSTFYMNRHAHICAGTWHRPGEPFDASKVHENIKYTKEDDQAIDDWVADHVETTWHSLGMSIVPSASYIDDRDIVVQVLAP